MEEQQQPLLHIPRAGTDSRPWLIAWDWQSRSLLLAELLERGVEMRAEGGMKWAMHAVVHERLAPPLVLLVTHRDPQATPGRLARLLQILEGEGTLPRLILFVGAYERGLWEAYLGRARILSRPCTVGEVTTAARALLEAA